MLQETDLTKIMLCGPKAYLDSIVKQIMSSPNPKLTMYGQYSHIGEVLAFFDGDPEIEEFVRDIGWNREFMEMFRSVSDALYLFNKLEEENEN